MKHTEFVVHPNRSEIGPDEPGRNGHFRTVTRPPVPVSVSKCFARVKVPRNLSQQLADPVGERTFGGVDWWFVVGAARTFARTYINPEVLPPFGFKDRGQWWWWDNTTTTESILDGPEGIEHVREYLTRLLPGFSITLIDNRG